MNFDSKSKPRPWPCKRNIHLPSPVSNSIPKWQCHWQFVVAIVTRPLYALVTPVLCVKSWIRWIRWIRGESSPRFRSFSSFKGCFMRSSRDSGHSGLSVKHNEHNEHNEHNKGDSYLTIGLSDYRSRHNRYRNN